MTTDIAPRPRPRFIVCEDGREYLERFERFLGHAFEFLPVQDYAGLSEHVAHRQPISGILLDLDFRRADITRLVDEHGHTIAGLGKEAVAQYSANQGLFILASLREQSVATPVLLFADIDDTEQQAYLLRTFGPLEIVPSHLGLRELEGRLAGLSSRVK
jgi:hypothetical protein